MVGLILTFLSGSKIISQRRSAKKPWIAAVSRGGRVHGVVRLDINSFGQERFDYRHLTPSGYVFRLGVSGLAFSVKSSGFGIQGVTAIDLCQQAFRQEFRVEGSERRTRLDSAVR